MLWLTGSRLEGSVVVAYGISCSTACGIFPDQEWNLSQWNLSFGLLLWLSKESPHNVGDLGFIPGLGRCPGEGKGHPLQYSGRENSVDRTVHWVAKSCTRLSDFHFFTTGPPHPEPSSLLPPHSIPLGRPSALAPSIQCHASNLDWQLFSYMIFYMFQCHSLTLIGQGGRMVPLTEMN